MIMENANEEDIKSKCNEVILVIEELMKQIEKAKLQNEQFVLDWLDKINEISVKY